MTIIAQEVACITEALKKLACWEIINGQHLNNNNNCLPFMFCLRWRQSHEYIPNISILKFPGLTIMIRACKSIGIVS